MLYFGIIMFIIAFVGILSLIHLKSSKNKKRSLKEIDAKIKRNFWKNYETKSRNYERKPNQNLDFTKYHKSYFANKNDIKDEDWKKINYYLNNFNSGIYAILIGSYSTNSEDWEFIKPIYVGKTKNFSRRFFQHQRKINYALDQIKNKNVEKNLNSLEYKYFKIANYIQACQKKNKDVYIRFLVLEEIHKNDSLIMRKAEKYWTEELEAHLGFNQANIMGYYSNPKNFEENKW